MACWLTYSVDSVKAAVLLTILFDLSLLFAMLEKAYDTSWKYGILKDLFDMGLKGRLPEFVNNFLSDRHFKVKVNSTLSDLYDQEMGAPRVVFYPLIYLALKLIVLYKSLTIILKVLSMLMTSSFAIEDRI